MIVTVGAVVSTGGYDASWGEPKVPTAGAPASLMMREMPPDPFRNTLVIDWNVTWRDFGAWMPLSARIGIPRSKNE